MNNSRFSWSAVIDWSLDRFLSVFTRYPTSLQSKFPNLEATDGLESTPESRSEEARKTDAITKRIPPKQLASVSSKNLDKEFWETF